LSKDRSVYAEHIVAAAAKLDRIAGWGDIAADDILYDAACGICRPWQRISAFRNVIVHNDLGDIDPQTIAGVIAEHVELLVKAATEMLAQDK
jgi:hypothetical protein